MVDKLNKKEVKIVHCPTDKMVVDLISKPLQGSTLRHHRNMMQGIIDNDFVLHKEWYKCTFEQYGLWDEAESDLMSL